MICSTKKLNFPQINNSWYEVKSLLKNLKFIYVQVDISLQPSLITHTGKNYKQNLRWPNIRLTSPKW